jgi:carboxyl-terminal processing protease
MNNNGKNHIILGLKAMLGVFFTLGVFFGGVYIGYQNRPAMQKITSVIHKDVVPEANLADFNAFWKAWDLVNQKFPNADKTNPQDRVYGAIKGMLASFGDPYTTFFPPAENKVFETEIAGSFSGVGIEIGQKEGILTVIAPLKDTPAYRAGIKSGDKIVKIGDKITNDMTIEKAIELIRGKEGTNVDLTIFRDGFTQPKTFAITRAQITLPTVDTEKREKEKVFIIHLYNFSAQSPELFYDAFREYMSSGYPNLLLDLRGNPGGYLDAAVIIGSLFIPEGQTIVKEIGKDSKDVTIHASKGGALFPKTSKLYILADKGSASASEILAGALSEHGIGTLVGEQTFGKGSVQEVVKLTNDTSIKVTVAKWYTPNGVSISDSGLTPKIKIPYSEENGVDKQLETAIGLFAK